MMELDVKINFTSSYMVEGMFLKKTIACAFIENKSITCLQEKKNSFHKVLICIIDNQQFVLLIHKTMHLDNHCSNTCNDMLDSTRYKLCNVVTIHKHKMNRKGRNFQNLYTCTRKNLVLFHYPNSLIGEMGQN